MYAITALLVRRVHERLAHARALAAEDGATALEYAILVLMGFLAAGAVAAIVAAAISSRTAQIR